VDYFGLFRKGKVKIKMLDYVDKMLADLPAEMDGEAPSTAANHLLTVNDDQTKVDENKAQSFDTYVAKTLFLCKRARPDIQTAVAFLSTRVNSCNEDDDKKLIRMLQFLRATRGDLLTLSAYSLHNVRWWVDGSYDFHPNMRSHTGGTISVNRSGKVGAHVLHLPLGDESSPLGDRAAYNIIHITRLCVTSHSQPPINAQHLMASNKLLLNNNK
jgi:hypothetical protein